MKYHQISCFIISSFLLTSQAWGSDDNKEEDLSSTLTKVTTAHSHALTLSEIQEVLLEDGLSEVGDDNTSITFGALPIKLNKIDSTQSNKTGGSFLKVPKGHVLHTVSQKSEEEIARLKELKNELKEAMKTLNNVSHTVGHDSQDEVDRLYELTDVMDTFAASIMQESKQEQLSLARLLEPITQERQKLIVTVLSLQSQLDTLLQEKADNQKTDLLNRQEKESLTQQLTRLQSLHSQTAEEKEKLETTVLSLQSQLDTLRQERDTAFQEKIKLETSMQELQLQFDKIDVDTQKTDFLNKQENENLAITVFNLQSQLDTLLQEKADNQNKTTALLPNNLIRVKVANANVFAYPNLATKYPTPQDAYVTEDVFNKINEGSNTSLIKMVKVEEEEKDE